MSRKGKTRNVAQRIIRETLLLAFAIAFVFDSATVPAYHPG
jgi:hypothetical protein